MIIDKISDFLYDNMERELNKRIKENRVSVPNKTDCISIDTTAKLNFAVFGDPQVSSYMFARECCFYSALLDVKNTEGKLDALAIVGDIAENGLICEYKTVSRMLNEVSHKVKNIILIPGNHDVRFRRFFHQQKRFAEFIETVKGAFPIEKGRYYTSTEINGYKFILLGTDFSTFEGAYIGKKQLQWLENELIEADKTDKPVFVFNHQTLRYHNGLPATWLGKGKWRGSVVLQSGELQSIFKRHSNIIFITGHLHYGTCQYTFDDRGEYKCVSVPTVGANNHGKNSTLSQGLLFSVYDDKIVVRAREFGNGKYTDVGIVNNLFQIDL